MAFVKKITGSISSTARDASDLAAQRRADHAKQVLAHIVEAKARKSGRDITNLSPEELIADLRAHTRSA